MSDTRTMYVLDIFETLAVHEYLIVKETYPYIGNFCYLLNQSMYIDKQSIFRIVQNGRSGIELK